MQTDVNATRIGIYWRRFNRPQRMSGKRRESENALSKYTSINFGENPLEVYNGILLHSVHARELRACPASVCGAAAACVAPICKHMHVQARVSGHASAGSLLCVLSL
jgi:hypothetical protein